ncbi:MAG: hypothetical protein PUD43_06630, partial [Clostridia bacterium]|nr:hypothetical protein [Clostridia bacterium]
AFAELASELGSIAGIGSALPAAVVVGIIIGITVYACSDDLSSTSINNLANNVSSVVTKVGNAITSNSSKAKSNAREAVITSVNYWKNLRKYHSFECTRISGYKGDGLGGIKVGDPLTEEEALARVLTNTKNNSDVFCTHADWAYELALLASDSGYPEFHFAHIDTSHGTKPYNLPHYHYLINGNNSNAHIFYEG